MCPCITRKTSKKKKFTENSDPSQFDPFMKIRPKAEKDLRNVEDNTF